MKGKNSIIESMVLTIKCQISLYIFKKKISMPIYQINLVVCLRHHWNDILVHGNRFLFHFPISE